MGQLRRIAKLPGKLSKKFISYLLYTPITITFFDFRTKMVEMSLAILILTLLGYQLINVFFIILYHLLGIEALL